MKVTTECRGEPGRVVYSVRDGKVKAEGEGERWKAELKGDFEPWSPENPKLYTLVTEVYGRDGKLCDCTETRFGVRTLEYGKGYFALNGVRRKFKGVCLHHDLGPLGAAFDEDAFRRQVTLLKEMGCDSIRTSHNMPGEDQLRICDERRAVPPAAHEGLSRQARRNLRGRRRGCQLSHSAPTRRNPLIDVCA